MLLKPVGRGKVLASDKYSTLLSVVSPLFASDVTVHDEFMKILHSQSTPAGQNALETICKEVHIHFAPPHLLHMQRCVLTFVAPNLNILYR